MIRLPYPNKDNGSECSVAKFCSHFELGFIGSESTLPVSDLLSGYWVECMYQDLVYYYYLFNVFSLSSSESEEEVEEEQEERQPSPEPLQDSPNSTTYYEPHPVA